MSTVYRIEMFYTVTKTYNYLNLDADYFVNKGNTQVRVSEKIFHHSL